MYKQLLALVVVLVVTRATGALENPFFPGQMQTASLNVEKDGQDLPYDFVLASPVLPGQYPVAFFLPGFAGDVPVDAHTEFINFITTRGIIMISVSSFLSIPDNEVAVNFGKTVAWAKTNANNLLTTALPGVVANFSSIALVGHSAGAKMIVKLLETSTTGVGAAVLLDPVDGIDPWGLIKDFVIHPPNKLPYTLPTLVVGSGLGPVPVNPAFPACAPKGMNFPRFYNASNCGTWMIEATEWGHADFLNAFFLEAIKDLCTMNDHKNALWRQFRSFMAGVTTSFVKAILLGECDMLTYLTSDAAYPKYLGKMNFASNINGCASVCETQHVVA